MQPNIWRAHQDTRPVAQDPRKLNIVDVCAHVMQMATTTKKTVYIYSIKANSVEIKLAAMSDGSDALCQRRTDIDLIRSVSILAILRRMLPKNLHGNQNNL